MLTIYKYILPIESYAPILMPQGAKILDVQVQNKIPVIWALVDSSAATEVRTFYIIATGESINYPDFNNKAKYIGTFQIDNGSLVFHLFEDMGV